jgi:hypothetical protein
MLSRAKKIAAVILAETTTPAAARFMPHNWRAVLADLAAELVELNHRLDVLENSKGANNGHSG